METIEISKWILPITIVVVTGISAAIVGPLLNHKLAKKLKEREEEFALQQAAKEEEFAIQRAAEDEEARENRLLREEEMIRFRKALEIRWKERDETRESIIRLARANQDHWWAFSALCRDWKEGRDSQSEEVRQHREEFHGARRELMSALSQLELYLGRLDDPRDGRAATRTQNYHALWTRFADNDGKYAKKLGRVGALRNFSEELISFLTPYLEASDDSEYAEETYLEIRVLQQDISDDYLVGATALQVVIDGEIEKISRSDIKNSKGPEFGVFEIGESAR